MKAQEISFPLTRLKQCSGRQIQITTLFRDIAKLVQGTDPDPAFQFLSKTISTQMHHCALKEFILKWEEEKGGRCLLEIHLLKVC